jgi:hypothetical protein
LGPLFKLPYLAEPPLIAFLRDKTRSNERIHQLQRQFITHDARAEAENVHVVVLHSLAGGVGVVTDAGANSADLVRRDRRADAAAADKDSALDIAVQDGLRDSERDVGIIYGFRAVGTDVLYVVPG